jgi:hypothetical protein
MRRSTSPKLSSAITGRIGVLLLLAVSAGLLAGCQTDGGPPSPLAELKAYAGKKEEPAKPAEPPKPPMTRTRAASECWMMTEKGRADGNLDKRADIVTKCIDDKMKTAATPPKT